MISTKGRYALRVMIDLAEHSDEGYISLKDIADRQEISKKYLESIVKDLMAEGLVDAKYGRTGGYRLSRSAADYSVYDILRPTEGMRSMSAVACLQDDAPECARASACKSLPLWTELDDLVRDYLQNKRLSDLL